MEAVPGKVKTSGMEPLMNWNGWFSKPAEMFYKLF
jgi:hypothetical protein